MRFPVSTFLMFVLVAVHIIAGPSGRAEPAATFSLTLSASQGKTEYLPLLPVLVTAELGNETATSQTVGANGLAIRHFYSRSTHSLVYTPDPPKAKPCLFVIVGPDGDPRQVHFSDWVNWNGDLHGGILNHTLGPGESQVLDYCLSFGVARRLASDSFEVADDMIRLYGEAVAFFRETGEYSIQLTLPGLGSGGVASNVLRVAVVAPSSPSDTMAHDILSNSPVPEVFLSPPEKGYVGGMSPMHIRRLSQLFGVRSVEGQMVETCRQILARSPDSTYAPFARLFFANRLSDAYLRPDPKKETIPNVEKQLEAILLLWECGQDASLPRRYREVALERLISVAGGLQQHVQKTAKAQAPSVESVLGESVDLRGGFPLLMYQYAYKAVNGPAETMPMYEYLLAKRFTPQQIERLKADVRTNPTIQEALAVGPSHQELQTHIDWALSELKKIPWRDPVTGGSRMKLVLKPHW